MLVHRWRSAPRTATDSNRSDSSLCTVPDGADRTIAVRCNSLTGLRTPTWSVEGQADTNYDSCITLSYLTIDDIDAIDVIGTFDITGNTGAHTS